MVAQLDVCGVEAAKQMLTAVNILPVVPSTLMVMIYHVPKNWLDGAPMLVHAVSWVDKLFKGPSI